MNKLKLFVLGEASPDPNKWGSWRRAIVIAHDEREALGLHDDEFNIACEIPMDRPCLVESIMNYPET
jgi:hypothetical protein